MQRLRKLFNAIFRPATLAQLDYAIRPQPVYNHERPHALLLQQIAANQASYQQLLEEALRYGELFKLIPFTETVASPTPVWKNHFFPGLDMLMLYTILARRKPKRYLEIGSGTSTKLAAKAKTEQQLSFSITCIDPSPRNEISQVADEWLKLPLQQASLSMFDSLEPNDILFFDGSHLLHANSDVQWFFMEVLPRLKPGVVIQIHDIYLPYDYPQNMCDRFYSEQYMLATMLLSNPDRYEILAANYYISEHRTLSQILNPLWKELPGVERHGGSFWFRMKDK